MPGETDACAVPDHEEGLLLRVAAAGAEAEAHRDPRGFLRIRVRGSLTPAFAARLRTAVLEAVPGPDRLLDLRRARLDSWDADSIRTFVAEGQRVAGERQNRVAALVASDLDYGIGRMFEGLTPPEAPVRYRTFRQEAEAIAWLTGLPSTGGSDAE